MRVSSNGFDVIDMQAHAIMFLPLVDARVDLPVKPERPFSIPQMQKAHKKRRAIAGVSRAHADALDLGYRVEVGDEGSLVTIGRDSPWW